MREAVWVPCVDGEVDEEELAETHILDTIHIPTLNTQISYLLHSDGRIFKKVVVGLAIEWHVHCPRITTENDAEKDGLELKTLREENVRLKEEMILAITDTRLATAQAKNLERLWNIAQSKEV